MLTSPLSVRNYQRKYCYSISKESIICMLYSNAKDNNVLYTSVRIHNPFLFVLIFGVYQ